MKGVGRAWVGAVCTAALVAAAATGPAHASRHHSSLSVRVRNVRAADILRHHRLRVRIRGSAHQRVAIVAKLVVVHTGHRSHRVKLVRKRFVTLGRHGRRTAGLNITGPGARALRVLLATCGKASVRVDAKAGSARASRTESLTSRTGCAAKPKPRRPAKPARFQVGAANLSFTPPLHDAIANDPGECTAPGVHGPAPPQFNGPRAFAYMEPYQDQQGSGHYDLGDNYIDCNGNGRWDGNFIGGGGGGTRYATKEADPVTARAIAVTSGKNTLAVEVVDQEGLFNTYMQQIRERVRADGVPLKDDQMFLSSTHDESAPQSLGLNGASDAVSATNDYWLYGELIPQAAHAIEQAYHRRRPATVRYAESQEPSNFRQCWSSYPYVDDTRVPVLQAVGTDGKVIATLADVSQHAETLGFNPNTSPEWRWYTGDWPYFFRRSLEHRYGGIAIEMAGSVGSVESPEVEPNAISQIPQKQIDESHPAGCRTLFDTKLTHVALGYHGETQAYGEQLAAAVEQTLGRSAQPSISGAVSGARADICVEVTNKLFAAAAAAGVFAHRSSYTNNCTVEIPPGPTGSTSGTEAKSSVAFFRIGDGSFISVPGEVFPFTYLRSFMGPQDLPFPNEPLPPWLLPHMHTPYRFIDGLGDDMLGYIFPSGNGVGVPGERSPSSGVTDDTDRFGCGHSDDSESANSQAGNIIGDALQKLLDAGGRKPERIVLGRYVLPSGALSRSPLGDPGELKCDVDKVFNYRGRAVGVEVKGGGVVHPAMWMNLDGRPQTAPDRNTRGYIRRDGTRVWVDVFPDVKLP
ncbi:MAG: hypothetical protein E6G29_05070 [Actinobacteria bacterium]|nr:MAG: hypothetical protein E6G29_05070 [Actinomycetota bacterium]